MHSVVAAFIESTRVERNPCMWLPPTTYFWFGDAESGPLDGHKARFTLPVLANLIDQKIGSETPPHQPPAKHV